MTSSEDRFPSRQAVRDKADYEGGLTALLEYGITAGDMPPDDAGLISAWESMQQDWQRLRESARRVEELLPASPYIG